MVTTSRRSLRGPKWREKSKVGGRKMKRRVKNKIKARNYVKVNSIGCREDDPVK